MEEKIITRRDFFRVAAGTAVAATLGAGIPGEGRSEPTAKVVLIWNAGVLGDDDRLQTEMFPPSISSWPTKNITSGAVT